MWALGAYESLVDVRVIYANGLLAHRATNLTDNNGGCVRHFFSSFELGSVPLSCFFDSISSLHSRFATMIIFPRYSANCRQKYLKVKTGLGWFCGEHRKYSRWFSNSALASFRFSIIVLLFFLNMVTPYLSRSNVSSCFFVGVCAFRSRFMFFTYVSLMVSMRLMGTCTKDLNMVPILSVR